MQLKKAIITNYKGIKHAEIPFTNHMVLLQGKNGSGKSSLIDGIISCLGGVDSKTIKEPIRQGEKKATNVMEFEDCKIIRTFTDKGSSIKMTFKDGKEIRGITKIAEYVGKSSFDPMEFSNMNEKEQRELMLRISGVDLTEADQKIKEAEEKRLELYRVMDNIPNVGNLEAQEVQGYEDKEEVSVSKLANELQEVDNQIKEYTDKVNTISNLKKEIDLFLAQIEDLQQKIKSNQAAIDSLGEVVEPCVDRTLIIKQMETAEETNAKIRKAKELAERAAKKKEASIAHNKQDEVVKQARVDKVALLAKAKMPVNGLSVTDEGVTFEGVPFKQINTAQQILIGVKIALSDPANKLKFVFIEKGSELDSESIAQLQELVDTCREKAGVNVNIVIGQVSDKKQENGFFLEEGELVQ